jgi:TrmH family RNA methyltransferase
MRGAAMTLAPVHKVSSAANPKIKELRALQTRKGREATGLFLAEGARTIRTALDHGFAPETLVFGAEARDAGIVRAAGEAGAALLEVPAEILAKIAQRDNPQSVMATFRRRVRGLAELDPASAPLWLALEGVRDPGNLGTCVRTADAAGAGGVILIGETCDPFGVEAVRATMGSIFAVPLYAAGTDEALGFVRAWPGSCVGTALRGAADYRDAAYTAPALIVAGTEQSGLTPAIRDACRALVKLPMRDGVDSLNLAVACGVMLYAVKAQLDGR